MKYFFIILITVGLIQMIWAFGYNDVALNYEFGHLCSSLQVPPELVPLFNRFSEKIRYKVSLSGYFGVFIIVSSVVAYLAHRKILHGGVAAVPEHNEVLPMPTTQNEACRQEGHF